MSFSNQQSKALDLVGAWLKQPKKDRAPVFRLFGFAGTGKTYLAQHLAKGLNTHFCSYTGKAALQMEKSGCTGATTIHSIIYTPVMESDGSVSFVIDTDSYIAQSELIVVDEASFCDEIIANDLLSFGVPVLALGDPEQLPAIKGASFFTDVTPDFMLTDILRQAKENPIIALATDVREGRSLKLGTYGQSMVVSRSGGGVSQFKVVGADQVLVGRNKTRSTYNARLRELNDFTEPFPENGERLVCLKNDHGMGIFNGGTFTTTKDFEEVNEDCIDLKIKSDDSKRPAFLVTARKECFNGEGLQDLDWTERKGFQEFGYGYALTVHKAQGSQWNKTYVFDESGAFYRDKDMPRKWLYTAITRASESTTIAIK